MSMAVPLLTPSAGAPVIWMEGKPLKCETTLGPARMLASTTPEMAPSRPGRFVRRCGSRRRVVAELDSAWSWTRQMRPYLLKSLT
jgi:hypothetical protein